MSGISALCRGYDRASGHLDAVVRIALRLFMAGILAMLVLQVVVRYILPFPLPWVEELAVYLAAHLAMWGSSTCLRRSYHLQVRIMWDYLPLRPGRVLAIVLGLVLIAYCGILVWYGFRFAALGGHQMSPSGFIQVYWARLAMPTGGLLIALQALAQVVREADGLITGRPREEDPSS